MEKTLSLSWEFHQNNICSGLSLLQQRGEFVDMTLAADGHHVKVHQMVLSLVSPYIKDLISTAQCPHPVIFLNNISYTTLCSILEYVYTGEVHIHREKLEDLLAAGKALHIKGLAEMHDSNHSELRDETKTQVNPKKNLIDFLGEHKEDKNKVAKENTMEPFCKVFVTSDDDNDIHMDDTEDYTDRSNIPEDEDVLNTSGIKSKEVHKNRENSNSQNVQYSVSNQGGLQTIINRYIYNLKYIQQNQNRYWRCVHYAYKKCPASVYTSNKHEVVKRKGKHNHPFHDGKILKKLNLGMIFSAFNEAENRALDKKARQSVIVPCSSESKNTDTE